MDDRRNRDSDRQVSAPLMGAAALGALSLILSRSPRRDDPHFWALTVLALVINLVVVAVCVYALIDLWGYFHSTTPCQRIGTC